jgi:TonB family protein
VRIQTDARAPLAKHLLNQYSLTAKATPQGAEINGALPPQLAHSAAPSTQFWVQFEVAVPRTYSVEVATGAGDIETQDIGGTAILTTEGGNIRTGHIGTVGLRTLAMGRPVAKLDTQGGHIQVLDVAGDLSAFTAGGHIIAGNIAGSAVLHSGGGHIRAGQIDGRADLQTEGGNITVGKASSLVAVRTGGGQIDFGEVRGSVRAQTGGGGIRILYVSGPMELQSSAGSICLTRVSNTVHAATAGGTITAWINPDAPSSGGPVRLAGASQLTSGNGDIVVFVPRNLAANIEAMVESGGIQRIEADPALELKVRMTNPGAGAGAVQALGVLNGGGAPLRLRTNAGRIRLQYIDSQIALRNSLIEEQKERLIQDGIQAKAVSLAALQELQAQQSQTVDGNKAYWVDGWLDRLQVVFMGAVREDPEEFKKHLLSSPPPAYPENARRAGIQGLVRLQVRSTPDGRVEVDKIIEGSPALADAAIDAVKQWRASPFLIGGRQVNVISTVTFNFQLH